MHYIEIRYDMTIWHNFKVKNQKFVIYEVYVTWLKSF